MSTIKKPQTEKTAEQVDALIAALRDNDDSVVIEAIIALRKIGDHRAVEPLIALLNNTRLGAIQSTLPELVDRKSIDIIIEATKTLGAIGDHRAIDILIFIALYLPTLDHIAAKAMSRMSSEAMKYLITVFENGDIKMRIRVLRTIGDMGDTKAVDFLLSVLKEPHLPWWQKWWHAINRVPEKSIYYDFDHQPDEFSVEEKNNANRVRREAAIALGSLGDKRALTQLIAALNDHDWNVRFGAANALGYMGDQQAIRPLLNALEDYIVHVRGEAFLALTHFAVPDLLETFKDKDNSIRKSVANVLEFNGDATAIPTLLNALKDDDSSVRCAVAEALRKIRARHNLSTE